MDKPTVELDQLLSTVKTEKELQAYLNSTLGSSNQKLRDYLEQLIEDKQLKKSLFFQNGEISRAYGYEVLNGTKTPSRDMLIKLCLGSSFSLDETNRALVLASYNKLYAKDPRDSILIFCFKASKTLVEANLMLEQYKLDLLGYDK